MYPRQRKNATKEGVIMNHADLCVQIDTSLRDAMHQLDRISQKILFVCKGDTLIGTLTDGDIRRFLINGGKVNATAFEAANLHPQTAKSIPDAKQMLKEGIYFAVPVINSSNSLLNIVLLSESGDPVIPQLGVPVVIMAGGKGTRLDPYTRVLPKPLIPVGELPIIEHIMRRFGDYGCSAFHVIVNYKKQLMKAYFNESDQHYNVTWYDEERPLGTGGGLYLLKGAIKETFFLTNCDILLRSDYSSMLKFHRNNGNAITMIGAYKSLTIPYGVVDIGDNGVIEAMREKPELSFVTNTGMYLVEPEVLTDIPDNTVITFPEIMAMQRKKGNKVAVFPVSEDEWMDMGQLDELRKMEGKLIGKGEIK